MVENLNREELSAAISDTRKSFDTDNPIIPFIEGDGIGIDIWPASQKVFDSAVEKAYNNQRKIEWMEVLAGQKAYDNENEWLPEKTIEMFDKYGIGIKGPLTTPVGGGIRSINVSIRQKLDLYACVRPLRWFKGVETPTKNPGDVDIALFRENTEDVYSGKELEMGSEEVKTLNNFLKSEFGWEIREDSGIGIKPISQTASERLIRAALNYAVENGKKNLAIVHKGNIMKFTEGAFRGWGYELVKNEFSDVAVSWEDCKGEPGDKILVQDVIADAFLQQILIKPHEFDVIATTNLNGDYASDALAAQIGGIGISPGGNINYENGKSVLKLLMEQLQNILDRTKLTLDL